MIQYGCPIRDGKGDRYSVGRERNVVIIELATFQSENTPLIRLQGYPALLQFIARLNEAASEMSKERV